MPADPKPPRYSLRDAVRLAGLMSLTRVPLAVAFVLTWLAIAPWLSDTEALIMQYPGKLLPVACWLFLSAAIGTAAFAVSMIAVRPE